MVVLFLSYHIYKPTSFAFGKFLIASLRKIWCIDAMWNLPKAIYGVKGLKVYKLCE
jgi:hypothetical protein